MGLLKDNAGYCNNPLIRPHFLEGLALWGGGGSLRFPLRNTLQGTNISPQNGILKMIFLSPRWDMLISWRVNLPTNIIDRSWIASGMIQSQWICNNGIWEEATLAVSRLTDFSGKKSGCFLKWWYPQNTSKWSFLVGKPMVVGYQHFRKPPSSWWFQISNAFYFHPENWGNDPIRLIL